MRKLSDGGLLPPRPKAIAILRGFVGSFIGIMGLSLLSEFVGQPFLMAPFGATCVLLFAASASPLAQPRNVVGGHFVSALIGLFALYLLGNHIIVIALAVALAVVSMQFFRVVHPPAGANPLVIITTGTHEFDFLVFPVILGSIFLVGVASLINNLGVTNKWPVYWTGFSDK